MPDAGGDLRSIPTTMTWTVPSDMVDARGLQADALVIVRSPSVVSSRRIRLGDRLLVDVADREGRPGLVVVRDGDGYALAAVRGGSVQIWTVSKSEQVSRDDVEVVGRVIGRWAWV